MTELYIVSGFLGAGKTTLIRKLLMEAFYREKTVLIENDFGEMSVDAALLQSSGVEVKEISAGCICCSLSGDFVKAVKEILQRFHPDHIIIEPSGVAKLSDIVRACEDPDLRPLAEIKSKITVVDVKRCKTYLDNFGEFFEDQIENADVVLLSRTADHPDKIDDAVHSIKDLNPHANLLAKPWNQISSSKILNGCGHEGHEHGSGQECGHHHNCSHSHDHESGHDQEPGHDHNCDHDHAHDSEHDHSAEEIFDTVTIRTNRSFTEEELRNCIDRMERGLTGTVLRAKGILRGTNGPVDLQYLPGDLRLAACDAEGDMLCIIGQDLDRQGLTRLFKGE